jgi:riboflavin biosynthesis pyrimidine reductase
MSDSIVRLFPTPSEQRPLEGTYLAHDLPGRAGDGPFIYSNFVASLDGRISELEPGSGRRRVPAAIANKRDWRLYMELAAQADVLLTTSRHLRAVADGRHTALLDLPTDLLDWRRDRGMAPLPALAAVSESLEIPVEAVKRRFEGPLYALVSAAAPAEKVERLEAQGVSVLTTGAGPALDGREMARALGEQGWRRIYSIAGPRVFHALAAGGVVDRIYLTIATTLIAGREFDTLTLGEALSPPVRFSLSELYLDRAAPPGAAQLFAVLDAAAGPG